MKLDTKVQLQRIEKLLASPVKLRMAEIILRLAKRRKKFGLLVILGWKNKWKRFADTPDSSQDLFARRRINIMKIPETRPVGRSAGVRTKNGSIVNTVNFDGAILVDPKGNVLHSGTMIEGLRPRATARKINRRRAPDLSTSFGFKRKVHMRHITAITSSYAFKGTTVFTVSEETDDLHIFEGGKIIYSTVRGEGK